MTSQDFSINKNFDQLSTHLDIENQEDSSDEETTTQKDRKLWSTRKSLLIWLLLCYSVRSNLLPTCDLNSNRIDWPCGCHG